MKINTRRPFLVLVAIAVVSIAASARAGTVTVSVAPNSIEEGEDAVFTFTNTPVNYSRDTKVIYYSDGSASYGDDFTVSGEPGVVIIPRGQPSADVVVHARTDGHFDMTEEVGLIVGDGNRYRVGRPKRANLTIYDVP